MASGRIPYETEQGIFKRVSGNFLRGTGNLGICIPISGKGAKAKALHFRKAGIGKTSPTSGVPLWLGERFPPISPVG
jgi:hypothetical protein